MSQNFGGGDEISYGSPLILQMRPKKTRDPQMVKPGLLGTVPSIASEGVTCPLVYNDISNTQ